MSEIFTAEVKTKYEFNVTHYGEKITLIETTEKTTGNKRSKQSLQTIMTRAAFDKMHRKNPMWMLRPPKKESGFGIITHKYQEQYSLGKWGWHEGPRFVEEPDLIKKALDNEQYDRVVKDSAWIDGYLRDIDNNPIYRYFYFRYINSGLGSLLFDIDKVLDYLKKSDKIHEAWITGDICWTNREGFGNTAVEFIYKPSREEFEELKNLSDFFLHEKILDELNVDRWRIENGS